ncbi:cAMP-binding domain of CRP or a regulatory subunit of cAMP-dependent protein kinases [Mucilaginibacter lappiensis]|uniref:CRP-like cAMP-binding protein n=1 Tax=Mucilaginibacter lappiensis TaxID=354630 RepID=A0ABR6PXK1_9SPHI|nr:response regulator [Mucilaginibacter lappiensis]MBB6113041.1 CRP-like cAMP-binding protein [Mucilaginibacter lappiensis]SIS11050.1 cAMP-binding domain of CRP or a regulatory subunit of cAMP-dependent protein kinases [Mucilaginibacter lappiensis]
MSKTVLIIEDNNDIRENIFEILQLANYTVYEAQNGKTGVELAMKHKPDIILCDIMMPELDGYGVLYMLNKNPDTTNIPFIFLTARAERLDHRKGMEMGADDYLTKPFDDMELLNAIETRLKKKEAQQEFYSKSLDRLGTLISNRDGLAELKKIIQERRTRQFKKGQVIYYEGDKGAGLYLLISGKAKSIKLAADGRELMTGIYAADDYMGINSMLLNEPHSDTATALEDSSVCQIPKESLEQLMNQYPDVAREFIKLLAKDIKEKEEHLLQMAYNSVRKKMADAMVRLQSQQSDAGGSFKITREDLAAMTGMATETVSRTLSDFKDEGLIEKKGSAITVVNLESLVKMKN